MTLFDIMGIISTVALLLPVIAIIFANLGGYKSFPALLVYFVIVATYNLLTQGYITASSNFTHYFGISNNLLDAPLMITFLTYFGATASAKRKMMTLVAGFIVFEILVLSIFGLSVKGMTIIMGPGIVLVLSFCIPFFIRFTKISIINQKAVPKAIMNAALIFAYGCYSILYILYYLMDTKDVQNTFLVYFFVSTFSSILLSIGIIMERKRVKALSELMIVRKELSELYGNEKTAVPFRPAVFDFDKEEWN